MLYTTRGSNTQYFGVAGDVEHFGSLRLPSQSLQIGHSVTHYWILNHDVFLHAAVSHVFIVCTT